MALKGQMSRTFLNIGILALDLSLIFCLSLTYPPGKIGARSAHLTPVFQPNIISKTESVLRRVWIHNKEEFPVVQQPAGNTNYVSKNNGVVTQFAAATQYGNIGLLAHNFLSGKSFSGIRIGQEVKLVYHDGNVEEFVVTEILRYQALDPRSPYSSFQNLDNKSEILTVGQMFDRAYQGERHLTLQTCIAVDGIASWGRLFVIATPRLSSSGTEIASLAGSSVNFDGR